jgi:hypothetical protein
LFPALDPVSSKPPDSLLSQLFLSLLSAESEELLCADDDECIDESEVPLKLLARQFLTSFALSHLEGDGM